MIGLRFFPALAALLVFLIWSWRNDRYEFLIQYTILIGAFGFMKPNALVVFPCDIAMFASAILWIVMRKPPILRKTLIAIVVYFLMLIALALTSVESMTIQIFTMRFWMVIITIIIPFFVFAGREFDFDTFLNKIMPYVLIICIFYIIDAFILSGNVLMPGTMGWVDTTFYSPDWHPLSGMFFRKYPPGLYLLALVLQPIARHYKLRPWQWAVILIALISTQTFTLIGTVVVGYIIFQGRRSLIIKSVVAVVVAGFAAYFIDGVLPYHNQDGYPQSTLRIRSSIDQVIALTDAVDDEDIAEFASGRMAQALPKVELVQSVDREWIGLGFLHPDKTHINQYIIDNNYYSDVTKAEELATGVEIIPVQIWINVGWTGLIGHTIFFFVLWLFIRKLRLSIYFVSVLYFNFVMGLAGFMGLTSISGLALTSLAYAIVILPQRPELADGLRSWSDLATKNRPRTN